MKKTLVFYWYAPEFYWHPIYNLHIKNLVLLKDIFDEIHFIISTDNNQSLFVKTANSLGMVLPEAKFFHFTNNKTMRESAFFYSEIVDKLDLFSDNEAIFFAHNKGVDTYYVPQIECVNWINSLYYFNLRNREKIDEYLNNPDICMIGTGRLTNYAPHVFASFLTYKWMYTGTFFWMVPSRVNKYIKEHNITIPNKPGRYHTEGFPGLIFPTDGKECITIHGDKLENETWHNYIQRTSSEEEVADFLKIEGFF